MKKIVISLLCLITAVAVQAQYTPQPAADSLQQPSLATLCYYAGEHLQQASSARNLCLISASLGGIATSVLAGYAAEDFARHPSDYTTWLPSALCGTLTTALTIYFYFKSENHQWKAGEALKQIKLSPNGVAITF